MASVRRDENGGIFGGGLVGRGTGVVALAAALTAVTLVESAYAGKNVQVDHIARGSARFDRDGAVLTIHAADRTIINYSRFNVARNESVRFVQPSATSRVLNRITSAEPSRIDGSINANGVVYFVNPSGIMFGQHAVINVGHFYAAAGTITDAAFLNNINQFKTTGSVVNQGAINGDAVALIGRTVANAGTIAAEGGLVTMVAGDDVLIGTRDGHIMVKVGSTTDAAASTSADSAPKGSVTNTGTVRAGTMALAGGDMYALAIGGSIKAKTVTAQAGGDVAVTGTIDASDHAAGATGGAVLVTGRTVNLTGATLDASGDAGGGSVLVGGDFQGKGTTPRATNTVIDNGTTLTASATGNGDGGKVVVWSDNKTTYNGSIYAKGGPAGGDGGQVEVSGKGHLDFTGHVDTTAPKGATGSLLLDPANLSIELTNPDVHGDGSNLDASGDIASTDDPGADSVITVGQVVGLLATTDLSLAATNDINLNTGLNASGNAQSHSLTLDAGHDVNINSFFALNNADVTLTAGNRVNINGWISTNGGDVSITSGGDVVANNPSGLITANHLTIEAATGIGTSAEPLAIDLAGGLEAHTTTGDVVVSASGVIDLGFTGGTKGGVIASAGSVSVTGDNTIYVRTAGHVVSAGADVTLTSAGGDLVTDNFDGVGTGQIVAGGQATLQASGSVTIGSSTFGDVHAGTGLSITATSGSVTVDNGSLVETDGGNASLTAGAEVAVLQTSAAGAHVWNNGAGTLTVDAPSFVSTGGGTPASLQAGGDVTIQADTVDFSDALASTSGSVTFAPHTSGLGISLADAPVASQLTLTGAQLSLISAATYLQIGDANAGDISLAGTITQPLGWNSLHLVTNQSVVDAGGTLQADSLAIDAVTGIGASGQSLNTAVSTLEAATDTGGIYLSNTGDLSVGGVSASLNGIQVGTSGDVELVNAGSITATGADASIGSASGNITVTATGAAADVTLTGADVQSLSGAVSISAGHDVLFDDGAGASGTGDVTVTAANSIQLLQSLTSGAFVESTTGAVTLDAPSFVSASGGTPASVQADGTVTIQADTVDFTDAITSTSGSVVFRPHTAGRDISLADAPVAGQLTLTGAQLSLVSAATEVRVGDATAGDISLAGTITQPLGWNSLHLVTGGAVADAGGTVQATNLAIEAATGIGASGQSINTLASNLEAATNTGGIYVSNTGDLAVGGVSASLSGVHVVTSGDIQLANAGSVTVATTGDTILSPGNVTVTATGATADVITDGSNTAIESTGGTISITAGRDVVIGQTNFGDVDAATGLTITAARDVTIDNGSNVQTAGGNASVTAGNAIQLLQTSFSGANLTNTGAAGTVTLDAPSFSSASGSVPASVQGDGSVTIKADTVDFSDVIASTSGSVIFAPHTSGLAISLADAPVGGQLTLTGAQLQLVSAADGVVIGDATAGDISLAGTITQPVAGWDTLRLVTGGAVSDAAGGTLQVANLAVSSVTGVTLSTQGQLIGTFAATNTTSGGVSLKNTLPLTVGSVAGVNGINTADDLSLTVTGGGDLTLSQSVTATGDAAFHAPVILGNTVTVTAHNTTFDSTVRATTDGAQGLTVSGSAVTFDGAIGDGGKSLTSLAVNGGASTLLNGASVNTTGAQTYSGPVTLGTTVAVHSAAVAFASTVQATTSGAQGLVVTNTGLATFGGAVGGGSKALATLAVSGPAALNGASVATTGGQAYTGAVTLGADTELTGTTITFTSTLAGTSGGPWDLTLHNTSLATFGGAVGAAGPLKDLSVSGPVALNGSSVVTVGDQTYTGPVTLGANATLVGAAITFDSTLNAATSGGQSLSVTNTDLLTLNGAVGASAKLSSLTVAGAANLNGSTVSTTGDQQYKSAVTLAKDTTLTAANVKFGSTVAGTTDGTESLAILNTATATFGGDVGSSTLRLESLTVDGATTIAAAGPTSFFTAGAQHYKGAFNTGANLTLTDSSTTFDSTVRGLTAGGQSLTISGTGVTTFNGAVGDAGLSLASLAVSGPAAINGGTVRTTGAQTYSGPATLGANTTFTGSTVTFTQSVDATSDGAQSLTVTGRAKFLNPVGGDHALKSLTVNGLTDFTSADRVVTTGGQTYNGSVTITGGLDLTAGPAGQVLFAKNLTVGGDVVMYAPGGISFNGDLTGAGFDPSKNTLDLQVPWTNAARPAVVEFASPSGPTRVRNLGKLTFENPAAPDTVPQVATIAVQSDEGIDISVHNAFVMARNQKMTAVNGSITIDVTDGSASLGDLNALDNIAVTADRINLMYRDSAPVLNAVGQLNPAADRGLNFVAGKGITFTGRAGSSGGGKFVGFSFGDDGPTDFLDGVDGDIVLRLGQAISASLMTSQDGRVLDLPFNGISTANPSTVRATVGNIQSIQPGDEIGISAATQSLLADIGVRVRDLTQSELVDLLDGRGIYVQPADEPFLRVALPRLNERAVGEALDVYTALFASDDGTPTTDRAVAKSTIRQTLARALDAYRVANPAAGDDVDPLAFRRFVERASDQKQALAYLNRLRAFLTQLDLLALTPKELADARDQVCGDVKPTALPLATFITAITGTPPAGTPVALSFDRAATH